MATNTQVKTGRRMQISEMVTGSTPSFRVIPAAGFKPAWHQRLSFADFSRTTTGVPSASKA
jgi:hypothetical protein